MNPFFSIIIPTYNREILIAATVKKILNQTFQRFEVIIVDDGSTDNTASVIEILATEDSRIKYYFQENKERGAARNLGIKKAIGEFFLFFDSDDYMHENHLEVLHQAIQNHPDYNLFATKFQFQYINKIQLPPLAKFPEGPLRYTILLEGNHFGCMICVKRNLKDLKYNQEDRELSIMEDWIFNLENIHSHPIFLIDTITTTVIDHQLRSMASDKIVIEHRLNALNYLTNQLNLNRSELKILIGYSYYFCAIHAYLAKDRMACFRFVFKSWRGGPFFKSTLVAIKSIIGQSLIQKIIKN